MIQRWIGTDISEGLSSDKTAFILLNNLPLSYTTQIMITNRSILKINLFLVHCRFYKCYIDL